MENKLKQIGEILSKQQANNVLYKSNITLRNVSNLVYIIEKIDSYIIILDFKTEPCKKQVIEISDITNLDCPYLEINQH